MTKQVCDIRVIDYAIQYIEWGGTYSCRGLGDGANDYRRDPEIYWDQYGTYVRSLNNGSLPWWWNKWKSPESVQARLQALRGFKQACIDAASKQKSGKKEFKSLLIEARNYLPPKTFHCSKTYRDLLDRIDKALR